MSTKHFVKDADQTVRDSLEALAWADPSLGFDRKNKALINKDHDATSTVSLLSGGGAGHEPAHAAYVGHGMLAGAVSGTIFASPSVAQIVNTVTHLNQPIETKGVLLVVKNYTGDVLHFNLAASKLRTSGILVEVVVVGDDVAVGRQKSGRVGRRGLAGTVFVHKIAGALAAKGASLQEVSECANSVAANLVTVAASLDHVHVPGRGKDDEQFLADDELELGMGIHNEPGSQKLSPVPELPELVTKILDQLLDPKDQDRAYLKTLKDEEVVLMVNNLGGLSVLELGAIAKEVISQLVSRDIKLARFYIGTFMTSLNGPGFSITLLKATSQMLTLLDAPTSAPGWTPKPPHNATSITVPTIVEATEATPDLSVPNGYTLDTSSFKQVLTAGCKTLIAEEPNITKYDTIAGDGDCGETLKQGAEAVTTFLSSSKFTKDAVATLAKLADLAEESMGGTSGALYSIFLHGATDWFRSQGDVGGRTSGKDDFTKALQHALQALQKVTPARVGDRTMMDALEPFVDTLSSTGDVSKATHAAKEGTDKTKEMTASLGRAVYVGGKGYQGVPDPGAFGVVAFLKGVVDALGEM